MQRYWEISLVPGGRSVCCRAGRIRPHSSRELSGCPFDAAAALGRPRPGGPQRGSASARFRRCADALPESRSDKYLKLADGGITDNFGLSGLVVAQAAAEKPFMPLTSEKAVRLRRLIFVVVNAGQAPSGNWSCTVEGPNGAELLNAVTDTAMNSAVRSGFDAFRLSLHDWEEAIRKWRCSLPAAEARRLGAPAAWRCSNFRFDVAEVGFDLFDDQRAAKLSSIRTSFHFRQKTWTFRSSPALMSFLIIRPLRAYDHPGSVLLRGDQGIEKRRCLLYALFEGRAAAAG